MRCLRRTLGISWTDHVTNSEELALTGHVDVLGITAQQRRGLFSHVRRLRPEAAGSQGTSSRRTATPRNLPRTDMATTPRVDHTTPGLRSKTLASLQINCGP